MEKDNKELSEDELEKINGGYIYNGPSGHKLNGAEITCPLCGMGYKQLIREYSTQDSRTTLFYCYYCNKPFVYTYTEKGIVKKMCR